MPSATAHTRALQIERFGVQLQLAPRVDEPKAAVIASLPETLPFEEGASVLDLGCGAGLFSLLALRAGCRVVATDVALEALELTITNAALNHLPLEHLETRLGSLFDPLGTAEQFDCIVANLPQTPCPESLPMSDAFRQSKWGGEDGLVYLLPALRGAAERLRPRGKLLTLQLGWLSWRHIDQIAADLGLQGTVLGTGFREYRWDEYEQYAPGLSLALQARVRAGNAEPVRNEGTTLAFPFRWHLLTRV